MLKALTHKKNTTTLLLNKPYGFLSQFTLEPESRWRCLAELIPVAGVYAAGRLDADSEGLLLLTSNGRLQQRLTDPRFGHWRRYWAQVEGAVNPHQLEQLAQGVNIQGKATRPARVNLLNEADVSNVAERDPPIRVRRNIPTSWLELMIREGRNRQVRRMTAAVGLPTLRLIRQQIDLMDGKPPLSIEHLTPGQWREVSSEEAQRLKALVIKPATDQRG